MSKLQQSIRDKFVGKLAEDKKLSSDQIEKLRILLSGPKKPKAEDLIQIFTASASGEVK